MASLFPDQNVPHPYPTWMYSRCILTFIFYLGSVQVIDNLAFPFKFSYTMREQSTDLESLKKATVMFRSEGELCHTTGKIHY